jgi:uroporphyrinogen-III decarboxylase
MSYTRGEQAINLQMPDRIPHTEYIFHRQFTLKVTGLDPESADAGERERAAIALARALDYDFVWSVFWLPYEGPRTEMGHGQYTETGGDVVEAVTPFTSPEQVLAFEPLEDIRAPSAAELTPRVRDGYARTCADYPEAVVPGGFYRGVFTWAIVTFGWEPFLLAAAMDEERFDHILEGFTQITQRVVEAHIEARVPVFLWHDDLVWSSGPPFRPGWYRKYIFPRYRRLWAPLREAGIKILFNCDGDFTVFIEDLAQAGADGFIIEPYTSLERIVESYGQSHVIMGNIDTRILTFGTHDQIRQEVRRCAELGRGCPGYFFAVGNHIPYNVPIPAIECYLEAIREMGRR